MNFEDTATAAKVAAESAEKAVAAAQAAAYLANRHTPPVSLTSASHYASGLNSSVSSKKHVMGDPSHFSSSNDSLVSQDRLHHHTLPGRTCGSQGYDRSSSTGFSEPNDGSVNSQHRVDQIDSLRRNHESHSFDRSHLSGNNINRRHSYNSPAVHSDIKFDESDGTDSECDEEIEMEKPSGVTHPPPERPPPPRPLSHAYQPDDRLADDSGSYRRNSLPRVHPKLPDYEDISARFEALKNTKR